MHSRITLALGVALIAAAIIGFLTVADDFRHTGEFFGVLGILLSGLAFLIAGLFPRTVSVLALRWLPVGVAIGAVFGTLVDRVAFGVSIGTAAGLLLARARRTRRSSQ